MKTKLIIAISSIYFFIYSFAVAAPWSVVLFLGAMCCWVSMAPDVWALIRSTAKKSQEIYQRGQRVFKVINQISKMDDLQMEQMMNPVQQLGLVQISSNPHFPMQSAIGPLDFSVKEKTVSPLKEISYQAEHAFSDLKKIEEAAAFYPEDETKLILFVSVSEHSREKEIVESLLASRVPVFAIQKDIFPNTDVIEISQKIYFENKDLFYGLEMLCSDRYKHFVFMIPKLLGHRPNLIV